MPVTNWKLDRGTLRLLSSYFLFVWLLVCFSFCGFVLFLHALKSREAVNSLVCTVVYCKCYFSFKRK